MKNVECFDMLMNNAFGAFSLYNVLCAYLYICLCLSGTGVYGEMDRYSPFPTEITVALRLRTAFILIDAI